MRPRQGQLRGCSGRQGDPGASKFFVSLEDDLMRIFGSERTDSMLQRLGLKEGEAIIQQIFGLFSKAALACHSSGVAPNTGIAGLGPA